MSGPDTFTRWTCDHCKKDVRIPGVHAGLPDERDWKQITLASGSGTTHRYGSSRRPSDPQSRLACSLECAQALLADRWRFL